MSTPTKGKSGEMPNLRRKNKKQLVTQLLNATILWVQLTIFSAAIPCPTIPDISDYG
jgi:hypothetical protein